ncbi:hypothetical protein VR7878_03288 [Vibrio ruber DSM 16370]|uniref:Uncharacterized protein n=1 Tax=Vibrio ruber (strain DSM 16370 / JCM 11486 / BCRC 17186 / CECT 7878 / LMG 23124 / VR1) TaxID=1123498 RepID=A0A1R4LSD7_VIBR1|nr:DUF883 C-terminal domain-containing protein [Vibrio ruber]SJN59204.1 hypothetical protein VR7878_03288 [Vibrio ruber DSM 16370]
MPYLTKLNRDIRIKRTEGKAALTQCLLAKQTLQFTATRFVRENPWMTLGIGACAAFAVTKVRGISGMMSSVSSISVLFGSTMELSRQFADQAASEQSISESSISEQ